MLSSSCRELLAVPDSVVCAPGAVFLVSVDEPSSTLLTQDDNKLFFGHFLCPGAVVRVVDVDVKVEVRHRLGSVAIDNN